MNLIETKCYRLKVGLFIQEFGRFCTLTELGVITQPGTVVMYDQKLADGRHVFRTLTEPYRNHYVLIPDWIVGEQVDGPISLKEAAHDLSQQLNHPPWLAGLGVGADKIVLYLKHDHKHGITNHMGWPVESRVTGPSQLCH